MTRRRVEVPLVITVKGWVVQCTYTHGHHAKLWLCDCGDSSVSVAVIGRTGVFRTRAKVRDFIRRDREAFPLSPFVYRIRRAVVRLQIEES